MRSHTTTGSLAILVFTALTCTGCGGDSTRPQAPTPAPAAASTELTSAQASSQYGDDAEGQDLLEHHRYHHGGTAMFLTMTLDSLGVSEDQRVTVQQIQQDLSVKLEPMHSAQRTLLLLLADSVSAGSVDKAKVDAAIAEVSGANAMAAQDATAVALNRLHAVLTEPQRAALVQKMEAHWQVWQDANAEGQAGAPLPHDRVSTLETSLHLSSDQVNRIRTSFTASSPDATMSVDRATMDTRLKAFANAFASDSFDAKTLSTGDGSKSPLMAFGATRMARLAEAAAPVLTAEQRTKYAERLRAHAAQEGQ